MSMRRKIYSLAIPVVVVAALVASVVVRSSSSSAESGQEWKIHDRTRPLPLVITPGEPSTEDHAGKPPSDAIVLFNGKDLSNWESIKGTPTERTRTGATAAYISTDSMKFKCSTLSKTSRTRTAKRQAFTASTRRS